jgi:tRNA A-37 threonylcarbamoyl transferase component Bud32
MLSDGLGVRWSTLLTAAAFGLYFSLLVYCEIRRPEAVGVALDFDRGIIADVRKGSPADRAGLRAGDALLTIDGYPVRTLLALQVVESHIEVGTALRFGVSRRGVVSDVDVSLDWAGPSRRDLRNRLALWVARGVQGVTLFMALLVALKRPDDATARVGAAFLASVGIFTVVLPLRFASVWRALPLPLEVLAWIPFLAWIAVGVLWFWFCSLFPSRASWSRSTWAMILAPLVAIEAWHAWRGALILYAPDRAVLVHDWSTAVIATNAAFLVGGVVLLVVKYRRVMDVNERRRVRVLMVGSIAGLAAGLPLVTGRWLGVTAIDTDSLADSPGSAAAMLVLLSFPVAFAYATLRHRMFDIAFMVRQGIRYTLARRLLVSLVPALVAAIVVDAWFHQHETLGSVLRVRGPYYAGLMALIVLASVRRETWLDSLDRRFFRESYNAQRLLRALIEDIRESSDFTEIARTVGDQIEQTLHPRFVQVLLRERGSAGYRVLAEFPPGMGPDALAPESKLMGVLRVLSKPIEITPATSAWLRHHLPPDEQDLVRRTGICVLVPITPSAGEDEAVLVLGEKRSEEPYSTEDHDLLGAIAHALALLLEHHAPPAPSPGPMTLEECPQCGVCYDRGSGACLRDGRHLTPVAVQRTLANRYRLERRLGRGGMGDVYAAVDLSLRRTVAAKLIRHDTLRRADAAERFHREARLAAGLSHPHVVTVYDFGVSDDRAFLIMELVEGVTLRHEMQEVGRIPPARVCDLLRGLCAAVEAAHSRRLVHRDLKPDNVMLTGASRDFPKILDFGVAKLLQTEQTATGTVETDQGTIAGTLQYMAPEQLRGEAPDPAWDIWSLAVMTHEMLTGVLPFEVASPTPIFVRRSAVGSGTMDAPLHDVPGEWPAFFAHALALDPSARPESAAAFFAAVQHAAQSC